MVARAEPPPLPQEGDLTGRMGQGGGRICLHTGVFVFHYKGSTIPVAMGQDREKFSVSSHGAAAIARALSPPCPPLHHPPAIAPIIDFTRHTLRCRRALRQPTSGTSAASCAALGGCEMNCEEGSQGCISCCGCAIGHARMFGRLYAK